MYDRIPYDEITVYRILYDHVPLPIEALAVGDNEPMRALVTYRTYDLSKDRMHVTAALGVVFNGLALNSVGILV